MRRRHRRRRTFTLTELLIVVAVISIAATFFAFSVRTKHATHCGRTKCPNNLRQLGLAALQYADDKRFFPHYGPLLQLDGDAQSNHATKVYRALVWYGYHDNPEGWICPSSDDAYVPINDDAVRDNMRRWFWQASYGKARRSVSPWQDGAPDPALLSTREVSYGWTRKTMNTGVRSIAVLGADRAVRVKGASPTHPGAVGNHEDGWNVLRADCTVEFLKTDYDPGNGAPIGIRWLRGTSKNDGYLAIADQRL